MNIWRSLKGLPRDVWILAVASLINRAGTMVLPFLILYLTRDGGLSTPRAGLAMAMYGVGAIIAAPIAGRLTDGIGALPVLRASLILTAVLLFVYPFVRGFVPILIITLMWALVSELFRPANLALVADIVPLEQLKPAYALIRLAINLGMSVGPAAAGFIATKSFKLIFLVDGVTTLAAGIVLIMIPLTVLSHGHPDTHSDEKRSSMFRPLFLDDRRMLVFLTALFLTGFVFFQHEGVLPLFLVEDLNLSPAFYGMLFTINTVMIVFLEVPLNASTAHWPHRTGLALGAALFAIGSGAFAFARGPAIIVFGIVLWTFGEMLLFPQASAYVAEIAPPNRRGEYMGSYSLAFSGAFAVAPWAGAVAFTEYGAHVLWLGVFAVGVISAVMFYRVSTEARSTAGGAPAASKI